MVFVTRCAAYGCLNTSQNSSYSFFRFPADNDRARVWLTSCHREDLYEKIKYINHSSHRLCGEHFSKKDMFANSLCNRLRKNVNPVFFWSMEGSSGHIEPKSVTQSNNDQVGLETEVKELSLQRDVSSDMSPSMFPRLKSEELSTGHIEKKSGSDVTQGNNDQVGLKTEVEEVWLQRDVPSNMSPGMFPRLKSEELSSSHIEKKSGRDVLGTEGNNEHIRLTEFYGVPVDQTDLERNVASDVTAMMLPPIKYEEGCYSHNDIKTEDDGIQDNDDHLSLKFEVEEIDLEKKLADFSPSISSQIKSEEGSLTNIEPKSTDDDLQGNSNHARLRALLLYPGKALNVERNVITDVSSMFSRMESGSSSHIEAHNDGTLSNNDRVRLEVKETYPERDVKSNTSSMFFTRIPSDEDSIELAPSASLSHRVTQTENWLSQGSPRKRKLREMIKIQRNQNNYYKQKLAKLEKQYEAEYAAYLDNVSLKEFKLLTYKFCPSVDLAKFIDVQVSQGNKKPKGRRYTEVFKNYCISLYFRGPKLYQNKLVKMFCLPSVGTLQKFIQKINILPGVNDDDFKIFEKKIGSYSHLDKICMICVNEIGLKASLFYAMNIDTVIGFEDFGGAKREFKPATTATVVMARGFCSNWKQALAYFLVNSSCPAKRLKELLFQIIKKLQSIGLTVLSLVCNTDSNNIQLTKILHVSPEKPFFLCGSQTIAFIFDTPHLLKSLRNNLLENTFLLNGNTISWKFIQQFYEHDKQYSICGAPSLTDSHMTPSSVDKMNTQNAAQVFSSTVASCMNLYIRFNSLPSEAEATVDFVGNVNNLFDFLNSSCKNGKTKFQNAYSFTEEENNILLKYFEMFKNLKILDSEGKDQTSSIECGRSWQITIKGFLKLGELAKDVGMKFLLTRRVSQDCLENFFGEIRQQSGGNCVNPTPIQFMRTFRKLFCVHIIHSGTESCEEDESSILFNVLDMPQQKFPTQKKITIEDDVITDNDYQKSDILEKNFSRHICDYLIMKSLSKHTCQVCSTFANTYKDLDETTILTYEKAFTNSDLNLFGNIDMPHTSFTQFITTMEILWQQNFEKNCMEDNVVKKIVSIFRSIQFLHPCPNFNYNYIFNLYARLRIYFTLKYANGNFKTKANRNRKLVIWRHS